MLLGPEMKSTGETMGIDRNFAAAFAKGFIGSGSSLPKKGAVFLSVKDGDKKAAKGLAQDLIALGFSVLCTRGTGEYLQTQNIPARILNKVREGRPHVVDVMKDGGIQLVFNTTEGHTSHRRFRRHPPHGPFWQNPLFHYHRRCPRHGPSHRRNRQQPRRVASRAAAVVFREKRKEKRRGVREFPADRLRYLISTGF